MWERGLRGKRVSTSQEEESCKLTVEAPNSAQRLRLRKWCGIQYKPVTRAYDIFELVYISGVGACVRDWPLVSLGREVAVRG